MMATKEDNKGPGGEAPPEPSPAAHPKRIPRLQSATELRGFPVSPNGTALGVGGSTPGTPNEPDSYYDDEDDVSPEEAERIEQLLEFVNKDLQGRPRPRRAPSERALSREQSTPPERVTERGTTTVSTRRGFEVRGLWVWICVGAMLGLALPVLILGHAHAPSAAASVEAAPALTPPASAQTSPPPQTPLATGTASEPVVEPASVDAAATSRPREKADAPGATEPASAASSTLPIKPSFKVQN